MTDVAIREIGASKKARRLHQARKENDKVENVYMCSIKVADAR